jgi:phosphotriesterase-related protein
MAVVETVRGPIDTTALGRVLMHEHVFVLGAEFRQNYPGFPDQWNEQACPGLLFDVAEPMVELFFKDIREGIGDTGVKAALLKCTIDEPGLTDGVQRVMRAVGQAHVETGAPITVHPNPPTQSGLVAQKVREQVGLDFLLPFDARADTVAVLAKHGYAEQMVLAHDAACYFDWFPAEAVAAAVPNWNCNHISDDVLPALRERGVSEDQITTMLVDNPRCYFEVTK